MSTIEHLELPNIDPIKKDPSLFFLDPLSHDSASISSVDSKPSFFKAVNRNLTKVDAIRNFNEDQIKFTSSSSPLGSSRFERKQLLTHRSKVFSYFPTDMEHLPKVSTFRSNPKSYEPHLLPGGSIAKLSSIFPCNPRVHLSSSVMPSLRARAPSTERRCKTSNMFFPMLMSEQHTDKTLESSSQDETLQDDEGIYFIQSFKYINR